MSFLRVAVAIAVAVLIALLVAAPAYSGTTGIIAGTVTDAAKGAKLAGVNVIIEGTNLTTVTDANGYYVITNVSPGEYAVTASLVGHADAKVKNVSVLMDVTSTVDFAMAQSVAVEEEVVVEARPKVQRDVVPTMYLVDNKQESMIKGQPSLLYQAPGLVATQPGVVADESGYPHIRGGRANEIGYLIDGIPVTEPITNGFATNTVTVGMDKMEIFTGGYRPEYGNAISGIFNQVVKTGKSAPGVALQMLTGAQAFKGVLPEIGGTTPGGLGYYVSTYMWHSGLEGSGANEVDSADTIGKFTYSLGEKNKLTLLAANGNATYQFPSTHTETYGSGGVQTIPSTRDYNNQSYDLTALTFSHNFSASSFISIRPYYFKNNWKMDALSSDPDYWWTMESQTKGLQMDYTNQLSQKHLVKVGMTRMASVNHYWAWVPRMDGYGYGRYEYTANTNTVQTGLYVQDQMHITQKLGVDAGLRYDKMHYDKDINPDENESQISPRLGLSYALDPKTNLRCSYGKMIQFVYTQAIDRNYTDPDALWGQVYYGDGTGNIRPERCTQYDIGWERQVSDVYSVQVTPFYRLYKDLLQTTLIDPTDPDNSPVVYSNAGEGTSRGVEFLLKRRASNNLSGWLSYTYSVAKAQSSIASDIVTPGVSNYVDWDQRHTIVGVMNYAKNSWTYSVKGEYGSGLPYNLTDETPNSRRVGGHTTFDLNIAKDVKGGLLPEGQMQLSIANLFNVGTVLRRTVDGSETARVQPRFISLSYGRRF